MGSAKGGLGDLMALPSRAAVVALLVLLVVAPLAEAHLNGARPILQRGQFQRLPDIQPNGTEVRVDLILRSDQLSDPLRHLVRHVMDPATGTFLVDYQKDASVTLDRFFAQWRFDRLVEYRDVNFNQRYERDNDTAVRSWRFSHFDWRRVDIQTVQVADVQGTSVIWEGNLTGAPDMRMQIAFAGKDFTDEGAIVRPQDIALYFDVTNIPERGVGSLYAMELDVTVQPQTTLSFHVVEETRTALLADSQLRRALFVWGGEGFLDGREQRLVATLEDESVTEGVKTARLVLHLPPVDRSMRFVMVSAVEYATESARSPTPAPGALALLALLAAVGLSRRRD